MFWLAFCSFQKQYYRAILERNRLFLYRGCDRSNTPGLLNVEMQLRKTCNHPFLINGVEQKEYANATPEQRVEKLIRCRCAERLCCPWHVSAYEYGALSRGLV